jgi:hypothetical protein
MGGSTALHISAELYYSPREQAAALISCGCTARGLFSTAVVSSVSIRFRIPCGTAVLEERLPVGVQTETKTVWSGQLARQVGGRHPQQVHPTGEGAQRWAGGNDCILAHGRAFRRAVREREAGLKCPLRMGAKCQNAGAIDLDE